MKENDNSSDEENLNEKENENIELALTKKDNNNIDAVSTKKIGGKKEAPHKSLDQTIKELKEKEKLKEIYHSHLYNIKDYIFFFILMISSSMNFSYLYLPFIFFGIIFKFLIGNNKEFSKSLKYLLEIISLAYSILLAAFKIVSFILIKNENVFINEHEDLFLNLGICFLRDKDNLFYLIMTFLGEGIMIIFSLYSVLISHFCRNFKPTNDTSLMENTFWKTRNLILLNYIFILSFSVFNVSFLTLFYMCVLQIIFLLDSININRKIMRNLFKIMCFLFIFIILIHISAINVLNIPQFQEDILHQEEIKEKDSELFEKVYSIWTKIGINYAYHHKKLYILKEWIGYFAAILSLITLTFSLNIIKVKELTEIHKKKIINLKTAKTILKMNEEEEKKNNKKKVIKNEKIMNKIIKVKMAFKNIGNYIKQAFRNILNFIISPAFIIQFSRIMSIAWIYFYRNFYSLGIFITLFFSFLFLSTKSNKYLTIFLLTPMVFISLVCFHFSNINGFFENYEEDIERIKYMHFGLGKYEYSFLEYYAGNLFYIFIMFLIYSFYASSKSVNKNEIKKENDEEEGINKHLLEDYKKNENENDEKINSDKIEVVLHSKEDKKKNKKRKKNKDLTLINIILKAIFSNIDKITLIAMYFVAVKSINLVHLILVIIFLIQILLPIKILKNLFEIIICLLQLLFLFELITDILKVYYFEQFKNNIDFMNFILIYSENLKDNNLEVFIYGVVYCFYFQYQILNFPFLKRIIEDKKITLGNYVKEKLTDFKRIQKFLYLIGNIILELYIWILIGLFIFISCYFEINLIFAIKLSWFFVLSFNFLKKIQNPGKDIGYSAFWHGVFLAFCCISTLSVYLYQFLSDDYIYIYQEEIKDSNNFFLQNLPNFGFTMYNRDDLYYNFIPHFGIIFVSVLFLREISKQLKKLSKDKKVESKKKNEENELEDEIDIQLKNEKLTEEEKDLLKAKKYQNNKKLLKSLSIRFFLVNMMKLITKFYWLLLFFTIGIIFCLYDLSYSMTIYIIIFDVTFIRMFHRTISKMTDYMSRPSYFISKVIRYSLVEVPRHIERNKYFRSIAFRYLLSYSFIFFILLYLYGVFDLFQNGCNPEFFRGCETRNDPIFTPGDTTEKYIKAFSYLFGIYVNIRTEGLMNVAWIHILLSAFIGFDVYAQKLENKFTEDSERIKKQMQKINNENNALYPYIYMADTNILIKLGLDLEGLNSKKIEKQIRESIAKYSSKHSSRYGSALSTERRKSAQQIEEEQEINSVNADKNLEENSFLKNKNIEIFMNVFSKANDNQQTLSDTNNSARLIWFIKKIFEEMIIFLLICIALTKLNILSFIYLIYAAYLTMTRKTMKKFYVLYCVLLNLILLQSIIFISNISEKTCPRPFENLLDILNIPWYQKHLNLEDKYAFFYGFGVNQTQILLLLLEFVQIMVIYIYLDFFSYSIYQDTKNRGEKGTMDKFNFGSIKLEPYMKNQILYMDIDRFNQYRDCLRNNFYLDIGETREDLCKKLVINKIKDENDNKKIDDMDDDDIPKTKKEELNKLILYKSNYFKMREKNRREGTNNLPQSSFVISFQEIIYLYLHILILFLIIIISLMITGLISIFYIVICFYYLINGDKICLGQVYGYPLGIKKILRICVICDIVIQTLYQIPYISPDQDSIFQKIFNVLGLIKIIDYESGEDKNSIELSSNDILEVIGKPLIYFFLSLQIIIYNSKDFKKFYLTFLLTQKFEFNKNGLINSYRFNNERINSFEDSMNLRIKSEKAMDELKNTLEEWNDKLQLGGGFFEKPKKEPLEYIRKKEKENENNENEINNKIDDDDKEDKKEKEEKEENEITSNIKGKGVIGLFEEIGKRKRKTVDPEEIKEKITEILLGGFITKFYLWFNKHSVYYKSMDDKDKKDYEKNSILGNINIKSFIEKELEKHLEILDLSDFDETEVDYIKDFFANYKKGKIKKIIEKNNKEIERLKNEKKIDKKKEEGMSEKDNIDNIIKIDNNNNEDSVDDEDNINDYQIEYKIKQGNTEININTIKFKQFENILDTKLFRIYLSTSYQIKTIISNLHSFATNNFDYFCYLMMIIDHMINSSFLTMFYPISIFCYALLENPRPKKIYWQICIYYTILILSIKFFFQLKLFNNIFDANKYEEFLDMLYNYKIGVEYFKSSFGIEFFRYIGFDSFILIVLSINRNILISNGLWEKREEQIENIFMAHERIETNKDRVFNSPEDVDKFIKDFIYYKPEEIKNNNNINDINDINNNINNNNEINTNSNNINDINTNSNNINDINIQNKKNLKFNLGKKLESKYDEENRKFFEKLFPKVRNEKPGSDFYPFYTFALAIIVVYILFFFTKMDQDKTYGPVNLDTTQFSGNMVLFLLLHVIILVYDRAIYICQNKNHLKYNYFIYKKNENGEGELLSKDEFKKLKDQIKSEYYYKFNKNNNNIKKDEIINDENNDNDNIEKFENILKKKRFFIPPSMFEKLKEEKYNLFYVQTEKFNKPLLHKYILHIFSVIICHIFIFVYFPMRGNYNLLNTIYCIKEGLCNDFTNNAYTIIFYILYLIYLFLSSFQIRLGYYDIKRKSLFKRNNTITNNISTIFGSIPFLPEIRNTIDWTFTSTCFDLVQWNQFEAIYDTIFDTYAGSDGNDDDTIGEKVSKRTKITIGGLSSFALVFILVIPLILFSSLNPTNKINNLTSAKLNVDLTFTYENGVALNYNLFENTRAKTISDMFKNGDSVWKRYKYDQSVQTRNFNHEQIQIVKFSETSDRNWDLAEPHIKDLIELLNITEDKGLDSIELNIQTEFERPLPAESQTVSQSFSIFIYDSSMDPRESRGGKKILALKEALESCNETEIEFDEAYAPPLRVTAGEEISEIEDEKYILMKKVQLGFQGCKKEKEIINGNETEINSYLKSYFTFKAKNEDDDTWEGVEFHIFNDKISETTSGYSVLTFYLTFILVAGSYVQEFLSSEPEKIMFTELPHPEHIVNLCEGIKISRYSYDFKKEEYLYTILIELMRSPDYLKLLTQSSIDHFKLREQKTNNDNDDDEDDKENEDSDSEKDYEIEEEEDNKEINNDINNDKLSDENEENEEVKNDNIENEDNANDDNVNNDNNNNNNIESDSGNNNDNKSENSSDD